jgi:nucleoside-diphosphate-sugar epimerase
MGNQRAIGHPFHITNDMAMTWNQFLDAIEDAAGIKAKRTYVATDFICKYGPSLYGDLVGDKIQSTIFDNSKIKHFVPGFCADTTFVHGMRESLAYFRARPAHCVVDAEFNAMYDAIFKAYGV